MSRATVCFSALGTVSAATRPSRLRRIALLPWMVAGVRTQYENLRLLAPPPGVTFDTFPIVPYHHGGFIERLPVLRPTHKGTLRSTVHALPLLTRPAYDAVWTQTLLPLLPFFAACDAGLRQLPLIVLTIDTTPKLMDSLLPIYYGTSPTGSVKSSLRDALFRYALARCTCVTPWSEWAARSFAHDYRVPPERIHVIPPGVDLSSWTVPAHRLISVESCPREQPFRLLFVGADFERKGGPLLVQVFRQHLRNTCELHLVTRADLPNEPGLHVYREFRPNEDGLRRLYETCDALVLPTQADCFSLAAIEAMATGLPVISCPVGGIPEIVQHGETGYLIPPNDGGALLGAITALCGDRARTRAMGQLGRQVAEERFDNAHNTSALIALLQDDRVQDPLGSGIDS